MPQSDGRCGECRYLQQLLTLHVYMELRSEKNLTRVYYLTGLLNVDPETSQQWSVFISIVVAKDSLTYRTCTLYRQPITKASKIKYYVVHFVFYSK